MSSVSITNSWGWNLHQPRAAHTHNSMHLLHNTLLMDNKSALYTWDWQLWILLDSTAGYISIVGLIKHFWSLIQRAKHTRGEKKTAAPGMATVLCKFTPHDLGASNNCSLQFLVFISMPWKGICFLEDPFTFSLSLKPPCKHFAVFRMSIWWVELLFTEETK